MKIKIKISKMMCKRTTAELTPDEIYFAVFVVAAKKQGDHIIPAASDSGLYGKVSEVKGSVKKGIIWRPGLNDIEIDIEDAEGVGISFALYEKDSGDIYNQLKSNASGVISPTTMEWPDNIDIPTSLPDSNQDWISLAITVLKVLNSLVKHMRKDDLIDQKTFFMESNKIDEYPRTLELSGGRAKYEVILSVTSIP